MPEPILDQAEPTVAAKPKDEVVAYDVTLTPHDMTKVMMQLYSDYEDALQTPGPGTAAKALNIYNRARQFEREYMEPSGLGSQFGHFRDVLTRHGRGSEVATLATLTSDGFLRRAAELRGPNYMNALTDTYTDLGIQASYGLSPTLAEKVGRYRRGDVDPGTVDHMEGAIVMQLISDAQGSPVELAKVPAKFDTRRAAAGQVMHTVNASLGLPENAPESAQMTLAESYTIVENADKAQIPPEQVTKYLRAGVAAASGQAGRDRLDPHYLKRYAMGYADTMVTAAGKTPGFMKAFRQLKQANLLDAAIDPRALAMGVSQATPKIAAFERMRASPDVKARYLRILAAQSGTSGALGTAQYREDVATVTREFPKMMNGLAATAGVSGDLSFREHGDALNNSIEFRVPGELSTELMADAQEDYDLIKHGEATIAQAFGGDKLKVAMATDFAPLMSPDSTYEDRVKAARMIRQNLKANPTYYGPAITGEDAKALDALSRLPVGASDGSEYPGRKAFLQAMAEDATSLDSTQSARSLAVRADRSLRTAGQDIGKAMRELYEYTYTHDLNQVEDKLQGTMISVAGKDVSLHQLLGSSSLGMEFIEDIRASVPESRSLLATGLRRTADHFTKIALLPLRDLPRALGAAAIGLLSSEPGAARSFLKDSGRHGEHVVEDLLGQGHFAMEDGALKFEALPSKTMAAVPATLSAYGKNYTQDQASDFAGAVGANLRATMAEFYKVDPRAGVQPELMEAYLSTVQNVNAARTRQAERAMRNPELNGQFRQQTPEEAEQAFFDNLQAQEVMGLRPPGSAKLAFDIQQRRQKSEADAIKDIATLRFEVAKAESSEIIKLLDIHAKLVQAGQSGFPPEVLGVMYSKLGLPDSSQGSTPVMPDNLSKKDQKRWKAGHAVK